MSHDPVYNEGILNLRGEKTMEKNVFAPIVGYEDIKLELLRILDQLVHTEK